jgi:hypothetical protein
MLKTAVNQFHPPSTLSLPKIHLNVMLLSASSSSKHYWLPFPHIKFYIHSLPLSTHPHAQPSFRCSAHKPSWISRGACLALILQYAGLTPCGLVGNDVLEHSTFTYTLKMVTVCSTEPLIKTYPTTRCHNPADSNINFHYREIQQTLLLPQMLNAGSDYRSLNRHRPLLYGTSCLPTIALRYYSTVLNMFKGVRWCPSAGCLCLSPLYCMLHKDIALSPRKHATQRTFPHTAANFHNESKIMKYINCSILGPKTLYCYIIKTQRKPSRRSNRIKSRKGKITRRENISWRDEWVGGRNSVSMYWNDKKTLKVDWNNRTKSEIMRSVYSVTQRSSPARHLGFSQQWCWRFKSSWRIQSVDSYIRAVTSVSSDHNAFTSRWNAYLWRWPH